MDLSRRSALQCLGAAAGAISSPLVWTKPSAGERIMVIDCHGHYTTAPRQLEAFRQNQIAGWKDASRAPASASAASHRWASSAATSIPIPRADIGPTRR